MNMYEIDECTGINEYAWNRQELMNMHEIDEWTGIKNMHEIGRN